VRTEAHLECVLDTGNWQVGIFLLFCLLSAWILPRNANKNVLNGALYLSSTSILEHSEWEISNYYRICRNQNSWGTWQMLVVATYRTHFSQIVDILEQLLFRDI
jgi:hypothetical protein